jgi:hypothetical protein
MGSIQWQLGREMGTIPAFASRTQENQENLCRDGRYLQKVAQTTKLATVKVSNGDDDDDDDDDDADDDDYDDGDKIRYLFV